VTPKRPCGDFKSKQTISAFVDAASEADVIAHLAYFGELKLPASKRARTAKLVLAIHQSDMGRAAAVANHCQVEILQQEDLPDVRNTTKHVYKWWVNEWQFLLRNSRAC